MERQSQGVPHLQSCSIDGQCDDWWVVGYRLINLIGKRTRRKIRADNEEKKPGEASHRDFPSESSYSKYRFCASNSKCRELFLGGPSSERVELFLYH